MIEEELLKFKSYLEIIERFNRPRQTRSSVSNFVNVNFSVNTFKINSPKFTFDLFDWVITETQQDLKSTIIRFISSSDDKEEEEHVFFFNDKVAIYFERSLDLDPVSSIHLRLVPEIALMYKMKFK